MITGTDFCWGLKSEIDLKQLIEKVSSAFTGLRGITLDFIKNYSPPFHRITNNTKWEYVYFHF